MASVLEKASNLTVTFDTEKNRNDSGTIINAETKCEESKKDSSSEGIQNGNETVEVKCDEDQERNEEISNTTDDGSLVINTIDITPEKSGGVLKQIFKDGEGDEYPGIGDRVSVRYKGWLLDNKEKPTLFDSTPDGEKIEFNIGRGMVIRGWDLGISTMKRGEVAIFICMPDYAYGPMGHPPKIPAYTPLLFEVELYGWKLEDLSPKRDNSILRKVLDKGDGSNFPNEGAKVKVKLIGFCDDEIFEENEVDFILGEGCNENIPEGLEIALYRFHLKEKSLVYLKNKYVTDITVLKDLNEVEEKEVKYEVLLLSFEKAKDIWEMNTDEKFEKAQQSKEKGTSFFKSGNYRVALRQFKWIPTLLEKEPGVPEESQESRRSLLLSGFLNIALCLLKMENYFEAIKYCDKALQIDPDNEKGLFRRGKAKMMINDCQDALKDFQTLCTLSPENKVAKNSIVLCHEKIKEQNLKDKSTYNKMFDKFKKQDEDRRRNAGTETGVWDDEKEEVKRDLTETERLIESNDSVLRDADIIELSNTAC
ncbi:peptidyl-prolyl cis-trans isomerase FKBP4-like [Uloborus diversus]|uniref:peptidyl-prolyl cis-trans isomerase FKBP4-like n=1 Tax=Uloborus diversus TaxID=327109 RepID=UPI00240A991D|nr:peptidyl-prolyl cis-trans isomerase FKBP4-like [Uloborus diversus]